MAHTARCHCGGVVLTCEGEPYPVIMCHCELCQRRTGAPFHIAAWFRVDAVVFEGETHEFTRTTGDLGKPMTFNFCPVCGTSVWWTSVSGGALADKVGIAGGCFADPDFPPPTASIYEKRRHPWVQPPPDIPCFLTSPDAAERGAVLRERE